MKKTKKIFLMLMSCLFLCTALLCVKRFEAVEWTAVTEGIYQDPVTGDFIFTSVDRRRTSEIYYKTFGFIISDAVKVGEDEYVETGVGEFRMALDSEFADGTEVELGNGIIKTTWVISQARVMEAIAATSPEWYNKILYPQGEVYLKFDAIIGVHDVNKYPSISAERAWSGGYNELMGFFGELWTKKPYPDMKDYHELETLYAWDPSFFKNHFDRVLMIGFGEEEVEDKPIIIEGSENYVEEIGKNNPDFVTYNYSTTGQFNLGDGIPTSEGVTNGYDANEWIASAIVCKPKEGSTKKWEFRGNLTFQGGWLQEPDEYGNGGVPYMVTTPYGYSVERRVNYWYLGYACVYDLYKIYTENEVYPNEEIEYLSYKETDVSCTINGVDMTSVTEDGVPGLLDSYHVKWPEPSDDSLINISGKTREEAKAKFEQEAEDRIIPAEEIEVRNDELIINGKVYMQNSYYPYGEFQSTVSEDTTHNNKSYARIIDKPLAEGGGDYGCENDEEDIIIPPYVANGEYLTNVIAKYKHIVVDTGFLTTKKKTAENSTIEERIKEAFVENEPIVVHTPTISPVIIVDPETGEKLEGEKTQLRQSAYNPDADYQLLLDGTYTMKFVPEEHFEHMGYPEMSETLYNKYCKFKQCAFPFTIQLDGKIYEPNDDTEYTDENGEVWKKQPGYTEWINLQNFEINDFYIVSWAKEAKDYVIMFRVAPENVVDQYGINHIDDTEWLLNQTLNGEPLYNYVSTYSLNAQVSGRIYGFQAIGINDRDIFEGFKVNEDGTEETNGLGIIQRYPFCPTYQEKKVGTLNRLGDKNVRYTVDGTLTNDWNIQNTLPFSNDRSLKYRYEGTLRKGNEFTFSVTTMANLWDEEDDYILIKPTFRYVSKDGKVTEDVDVYYHADTSDGKERNLYVPYGSDKDLNEHAYEFSISDLRNDGAYYYKDLWVEELTGRKLTQDDAEYSTAKCNEYLYNKNKEQIPTWPENVYKCANNYLNKPSTCYCLSLIRMNSELRLLTGNLEQLERNLDKQGDDLEYLEDITENGNPYVITEQTNPELWDKHRMSMQTWFGTYLLPDNIFITNDLFYADTNDDGIDEEYDVLWDYIVANGYIEGNEDFFITDGFLVVNFEIVTVNDGEEHLIYYADNNGKNLDQWQVEGANKTATVGDPRFDNDIEIELRSGDVAIYDLEYSVKDWFYVGYNRIN